MVILGLGSNLNDRLANLRLGLSLIKQIPNFSVCKISPVYISDALLPANAPANWDIPYLNLALRCETTLSPYELLDHIKKIEITAGRTPQKNWGPRVIDIDILAWDDFIQYDEKLHIPHENLHERPFALWPLADVAPRWIYPLPGALQGKAAAEISAQWGCRFNGNAPLHTRQIQQRIDAPELIGILNVTPDSFSDGGSFLQVEAALEHARKLVAAGAEIIDIGAEATGPNSKSLTAQQEWSRLEPVLNALLPEVSRMLIPPKISIDTRHLEVAHKALALNVDWINDVSGLTDPAMGELIAAQNCDVVVMHNLGIPISNAKLLPRNQDPVSGIYQWGELKIAQLEKWGIAREKIIFDVGIGFGNAPEQALEIIQHIPVFHGLQTRLLVGHSRKSFLQQFTTLFPAERDLETIVLSLFLAKQSVHYLRVHNIDAHARSFKVATALGSLC